MLDKFFPARMSIFNLYYQYLQMPIKKWYSNILNASFISKSLIFSSKKKRFKQKIDLRSVRRIGVIRLDGMGDLIVTTPFLRELRRSAPQATIEVVIFRQWEPLVRNCPYIDKIICFEMPSKTILRGLRERIYFFFWTKRMLKPRAWDLVLLPQIYHLHIDCRWIAWFSGSKLSAGRKCVSDLGDHAWGFLDHVTESLAFGHDVVACLDWLVSLGGKVNDQSLEINLDDSVRKKMHKLIYDLAPSRKRVAVGLGASNPIRIWPADRFAKIAARLVAADIVPVLIGGKDCCTAAKHLQGHLGESVIDLTGKLELDATAALLEKCDLFVGNDSGPMHLAAAMGIPVVEISGDAADVDEKIIGTPKRIRPWCRLWRIVQPASGPPGRNIRVDRVEVDEVWRAMMELFQESQAVATSLKNPQTRIQSLSTKDSDQYFE